VSKKRGHAAQAINLIRLAIDSFSYVRAEQKDTKGEGNSDKG
jgi:uncharacterized protein YhfF